MRQFVQCEENRPILFEEETLDFELMDVSLYFRPTDTYGLGSLFVTSRRIVWIGEEKAFDFDVPFISLHAISRDPSSFPLPCLYCQLDIENNIMNNEEEEMHEEREGQPPSEVFFVPKDESALMPLFEAFSKAALLNPDETEEGDDEEGEAGDFIYNVEEVQLGAEQARRLDHLESVFTFPHEEDVNGHNGQFEDAEEEEEEELDGRGEVGRVRDENERGMEVDEAESDRNETSLDSVSKIDSDAL